MDSIIALLVGVGLGIIGLFFSKKTSQTTEKVVETNNELKENHTQLKQLEVNRENIEKDTAPKSVEELLNFLNKDKTHE